MSSSGGITGHIMLPISGRLTAVLLIAVLIIGLPCLTYLIQRHRRNRREAIARGATVLVGMLMLTWGLLPMFRANSIMYNEIIRLTAP